jgi:dihydroorotate dehydrogenase
MSLIELFMKAEHVVRPRLSFLSPSLYTKLYSNNRSAFLKYLYSLQKVTRYVPPSTLARTFWGISFKQPLFNAAGMFKNAEGYDFVASQGAGAYIAGTSTSRPRIGNSKNGIYSPFTTYPKSKTASNWLGLPNIGHKEIHKNIATIEKVDGCPIGISVSASPEIDSKIALQELVEGLFLFQDSQVDFIELNESCPNVAGHTKFDSVLDEHLLERLSVIANKFLSLRTRNLPVIVKFSNDTATHQVPELINQLIAFGFDGVNFGNTSIQYQQYRQNIHTSEIDRYDYFTKTFGGGLSGEVLKRPSKELTTTAVKHLQAINLNKEFHIIRTGGIDSLSDLFLNSEEAPSLYQWYTGYFEMLSKHGLEIYKKFYEGYSTRI